MAVPGPPQGSGPGDDVMSARAALRHRRDREEDYDRLLAQERLILSVTERVLEVLAEQGLTQCELAERLDVSEARVSQVLCGEKNNLTLRAISDIAHVLGLDALEMLRGAT